MFLNELSERFDRLSNASVSFISVIVTLLIGCIEFNLDPDILIYSLYFLPIAFATRYGSPSSGYAVAALACVITVLHEETIYFAPSDRAVGYWNSAVLSASFIFFAYILERMKKAWADALNMARSDSLTGLMNAAAFREMSGNEMHRARRYNRPLTLMYFDLDNFKLVNDQHGHSTGDTVLKLVALVIKKEIRHTDLAARLGGDEFAVLFPELNRDNAKLIVPRLRKAMLAEMQENQWPVTFSIGAVTFLKPPETCDDMIRVADSVMYSAKNNGKNRIEFAFYEGVVCATDAEVTHTTVQAS